MIKIIRNMTHGKIRAIGYAGVTRYCDTKSEAIGEYRRIEYDQTRRDREYVLRNMCGASARDARLGMGVA